MQCAKNEKKGQLVLKDSFFGLWVYVVDYSLDEGITPTSPLQYYKNGTL